MEYHVSGAIINPLSGWKGIQEELSRWISATPMELSSLRPDLYQVLAENVRQDGLSNGLRDEIKAAARQSQLNRDDIEILIAIAARVPEQLPSAVANQMALMLVYNRNGESSKTAALGKACKALGKEHFARSLSRWSVARDLQTRSTSRWLPDYLGALPEHARRDTLKTLMPYLGINAVRLDAGGDESVLFTALLDLGMNTEATDLIERYLRRLRLIDAPSASGYRFRPYYQRRMGETEDRVGGALHDALAVALARLNRPDDYKRVLTRRALVERWNLPQSSISPYGYRPSQGSTSGPSVEDHTRALPEPDQVQDIGRYIDIHLDVSTWLRAHGQLSREAHVARLCMLGKWCVERGLQTRAGELLTLAEKNSDGMLTGRLWIADLHRLLGREEPAAAIERELLRQDLLPMPRVPAALKAIAENEGQAQADTIAYRIATYSNHPDVLPSALRHAQTQGPKEIARDLAKRLRKVNTLFLPPDQEEGHIK
jgi:hypothetical protein